jgi:pimeloyl-ACP methyl ester carboxylesterase
MIETRSIDLPHGIRLSCRCAGSALGAEAPRVMLLHGFPEAAFVWDEVMQRLAQRAHCIAPNLRGYEDSSAPAEVAAYRPKHLVADVAALIEHFGAPLDLLVAHDWGGALAWNLAAQQPHLLKRLLIINSPHPATFLRELRDNPAQQLASAYMTFLCRPDAEALLAANRHERLWRMLSRPGPGESAPPGWATEALRERYDAVWSKGLTGALNYYRASPLRPPQSADDTLMSLQLPDDAVTVRLPTRVLWGERDVALLPGLLDGLERWVPQMDLQRVPDASHWMVHEKPDWVSAQIAAAL